MFWKWQYLHFESDKTKSSWKYVWNNKIGIVVHILGMTDEKSLKYKKKKKICCGNH